MAVHVMRSAVVAAPGPASFALAQRGWPDHTRVLTASIMRDVGIAAARAEPLSPRTAYQVRVLSERNQLAPEPFLVLGAQAFQNRHLGLAERLLLEARRRDPRSPAARYLLASLYIETGRLDVGLRESAALARLLPGAAAQLAPALAQYVTTPGAAEQVVRLLKAHPDLAPALFYELAANPSNADLLVRLASTVPAGAFSQRWQKRLISELLNQHDYEKAWSLWAKLNGKNARLRQTVHDPGFQDALSAPPFNWELSRTGGVVERRNGSLQVLYFGRDEVTLARQVLVLRPGNYELEMDVSGNINGSQDVRWELSCLPGNREIARTTLRDGARATLRARFAIPSGSCRAQDLRLQAGPGDFPGASDFSIANFELREAGRP
jgi:hypothetical protein